jgi:hypothetical protein
VKESFSARIAQGFALSLDFYVVLDRALYSCLNSVLKVTTKICVALGAVADKPVRIALILFGTAVNDVNCSGNRVVEGLRGDSVVVIQISGDHKVLQSSMLGLARSWE